jgi:hypothetical protein
MPRQRIPASLQPDPRFAPLKADLLGRLEQIVSERPPRVFVSLLDGTMRGLLEKTFLEVQAHEGTLWLADWKRNSLVPVFNSGPQARQIVGRFRQPFAAGLVSMVYATEQPFLENEVYKNKKQSKQLDTMLRVQTWSLLIVPFYFLNACRGVLSCVQLKRRGAREPDPPGFQPAHLTILQQAAALTGSLLDRRLLALTFDLPWK